MLIRLAWSSVPSARFATARLGEIIAAARCNNRRDGVSGMLVYTGAHFLSILEGEEAHLEALWVRLGRDPRHTHLFRIGESRVTARQYPDWMMGYLNDPVTDAQIESLRALELRAGDARTRRARVIKPPTPDGRRMPHPGSAY